jgi:hypothetical protein
MFVSTYVYVYVCEQILQFLLSTSHYFLLDTSVFFFDRITGQIYQQLESSIFGRFLICGNRVTQCVYVCVCICNLDCKSPLSRHPQPCNGGGHNVGGFSLLKILGSTFVVNFKIVLLQIAKLCSASMFSLSGLPGQIAVSSWFQNTSPSSS